MSLVPYRGDSLIFDDPSSQSLVIVDPSQGSLKLYQQTHASPNYNRLKPSDGPNVFLEDASYHHIGRNDARRRRNSTLSAFICPQCGSQIDPASMKDLNKEPGSTTNNFYNHMSTVDAQKPHKMNLHLSQKYFTLLGGGYRRYALENDTKYLQGSPNHFFIPEDLFLPGYFHKFFKTLDLLGRGARGSVYKVVHSIADIELGVFALKKIPIANDISWFEKCIREVKALSSITHESVNLITYNHVWLEMDSSCGHVRTFDGKDTEVVQDIPCIFILQQYCDGGNLEDVILKDVFQKKQELESIQERKARFRSQRERKGMNRALGLSTANIISIIKDIAQGLRELHKIGLIHRDLKPSNCLLLQKFNAEEEQQQHFPTVVIGDLGESQAKGELRTATGATGTLEFTAPEVVISPNDKSLYHEYTFATDMYSLGMLLYFVLFGELPFDSDLDILPLKQEIRSLRITKEALLEKCRIQNILPINDHILDLLLKLLSVDPKKRPTAEEVIELLEGLNSSSQVEPSTVDTEKLSEEDHENGDDDILSSLVPFDSQKRPEPVTHSFSNKIKYSYLLMNIALAAYTLSSAPIGSIRSYLSILLLGIAHNNPIHLQRRILLAEILLSLPLETLTARRTS